LEQTHSSLKRNLLEESYEALEAIDSGDPSKLSEELGDVLVQVAFHCQIAEEAGTFQAADVIQKINDKLVRRHPHVFADATASDAREVEQQWEKLKEAEGTRRSRVEGIPKDLPALAAAQLAQDRVARDGFEWDNISGVLDKVSEEVEELKQANTDAERASEFGDLLLALVNLGRWMGIHAEDALRQANTRFTERYQLMEEAARQRDTRLRDLTLEEKEALWQQAKRQLRGE
jgi:tetrapyrrole methylase family protein/MazG family protein